MELHRSRHWDRKSARVGFGYAAIAALAGLCIGAGVGGPAWAVSVMVWGSGVVALGAAIAVAIGSVRPFRIVIAPDGLDVRANGQAFAGPWALVRAISIERTPADRDILVLWVADEVRMRHRPTFPAAGAGPKGHVLVDLENVAEAREQIESALRRHAGDRFRSLTSA
ncbi:hypothetical protein [Phytohabitans kaempferiae]|uniref:PH domain-containing protein n=1 Tax=Phytohabitans kaempferiae TaxID=1620943 RepID=A0ABV6M9E8_9ACTN